MDAEDLLHFIELKPFSRRWAKLQLDDAALASLQLTIMDAPESGKEIVGTGGLRKMRFAPPQWARGKSHALRVCYVFYEEHKVVLLALVY